MAAKGFLGRLFGRNDSGGGCCGGGVSIIPEDENTAGSGENSTGHDVVVVTNSCCNPADKPLEDRAFRVVDQAIADSGVEANVRAVSATDAIAGAMPSDIVTEIQNRIAQGTLEPPVVLVDGRIVTGNGVDQNDVVAGLVGVANGQNVSS
ncbi:hypothetical protein [Saccharomonospora saliphila]|uniref:hypothetical protein n=1 Tax=Saccharomonospora saliphila TaxID=369829 RepID=UPI0012F97632|nr:hypothetical protein [Saccharomonospora saliphila]